MPAQDLVVALTGASGSPYGVRLVGVLLRAGRTVHLIDQPRRRRGDRTASWAGPSTSTASTRRPCSGEVPPGRPAGCTTTTYRDFSAGIASGSFLTGGMAVCPCSMGTVGGDRPRPVGKPDPPRRRRPPEGAPEAGARAAGDAAGAGPAPEPGRRAPRPGRWCCRRCRRSTPARGRCEDMVDFVVGRVCDQLGVEHRLFERWGDSK